MPDKITATKSGKDGCVGLRIELKANGYPGATVAVKASVDLTTGDARHIALGLIALADEADAKAAEKAAEKAGRDAWLEREIAAGRMKVFSAAEFFGR